MLRVLKYLLLILLVAAPVSAKYWNGSAWVDNTCNYYDGAAWVPCDEFYYNGSAWVPVNATTPPPAGTHYAGYPTDANGVPAAPTGAWEGYGGANDGVFARRVVATEAGTAIAINIRVGELAGLDTCTASWLCLYNDMTLVGQSSDQVNNSIKDDWTGYIPITAVSGQSLDFASGDTLRATVVYVDQIGSDHSQNDAGDTTSIIEYDTAQGITSPPTTVNAWTESSFKGLGIVLEYTTE